jgi:ABC-type transport system involved in cytochrome bd biosynthesis fused ATPase/permease subunit
VIFIAFPLIILPIIFLAKRLKRVSRQLQSNQEKFASVLIDFLAGIQTVKIFAMEMFSFKKYKEQNDRMAILEGKTAKYGLLTRPILHAITTVCLAVVVLFGLYTLKLTLSELLIFCGLLQRSYEAIKKFGDENSNIQKGVVAAERMFEVLNLKPEIEDHVGAIELLDFEDTIEFDHVWFRYGEEWILKDVSFTVSKGETVALVGPTGSGKSTIVQLLPRLYEVQKGKSASMGNLLTPTPKNLSVIGWLLYLKSHFFSVIQLQPTLALVETFLMKRLCMQPERLMLKSSLCAFHLNMIPFLPRQGKTSQEGNSSALRLQERLSKKPLSLSLTRQHLLLML